VDKVFLLIAHYIGQPALQSLPVQRSVGDQLHELEAELRGPLAAIGSDDEELTSMSMTDAE
jgi:hypothetical protein